MWEKEFDSLSLSLFIYEWVLQFFLLQIWNVIHWVVSVWLESTIGIVSSGVIDQNHIYEQITWAASWEQIDGGQNERGEMW